MKPSPFSELEEAILRTLTYSDIFEYPLRPAEIHRDLIGQRAPLEEVEQNLANGSRLSEYIESEDGYYFLRGRGEIVRLRSEREQTTEALLKRESRILRLVASLPFVRMVALSGAACFGNCRSLRDDIDVFIITSPARLWTVNLPLTFISNRRHRLVKRFVLCPNHLRPSDNRSVEPRDIFNAHQVTSIKPIYGYEEYLAFIEDNPWVKAIFSNFSPRENTSISLSPTSEKVKGILERMLGGSLGDALEKLIFQVHGGYLRWKVRRGRIPSKVKFEKDLINTIKHNKKEMSIASYQERVRALLSESQSEKGSSVPTS